MTDRNAELPLPAQVVLGMLSLGPRSGYEIKRDVDRSIRYFWTLSQAQIYPSLERLERDGLITGHDEPSGRRPRRVFRITDAGRAVLRAWVARTEPMPFELRDVGMLKLFFADVTDQDDAAALLSSIRDRSRDRVAALVRTRPDAEAISEDGNGYPLLTLEMGIAVHQAMADVCARFALDATADRAGHGPA
jgi:PadR family transcriptional regulator, regulatory protein AphA